MNLMSPGSIDSFASLYNWNQPGMGPGWVKAADPSNVAGAGGTDWMGNLGFKDIGSVLGAIAQIGNLFSAKKALGLAEDQFDFTKKAWEKDYQNRRADYNRQIEDRANARATFDTEGRTVSGQEYVKRHSI